MLPGPVMPWWCCCLSLDRDMTDVNVMYERFGTYGNVSNDTPLALWRAGVMESKDIKRYFWTYNYVASTSYVLCMHHAKKRLKCSIRQQARAVSLPLCHKRRRVRWSRSEKKTWAWRCVLWCVIVSRCCCRHHCWGCYGNGIITFVVVSWWNGVMGVVVGCVCCVGVASGRGVVVLCAVMAAWSLR